MRARPPGPRQPPRRRQPQPGDRRNFWIGIGLGMIPVVLLWIAIGLAPPTTGTASGKANAAAGPIAIAGIVLYVVSIVTAIVFMNIARFRRVGQGLLAMVFIGPVVWSVGCIVILTHH